MKLSIAIVNIYGTPFDGRTVWEQALGGTESAVLLLSRELVKIGFEVTIFTDCDIDNKKPGTYEGVNYRTLQSIPQYDDHKFDVMISVMSMIPFMIGKYANVLPPPLKTVYFDPPKGYFDKMVTNARYKVVWVHNTSFPVTDQFLEPMLIDGYIDKLFTTSDFQTIYTADCQHFTMQKRMFEVMKPYLWEQRSGVHLYDVDTSLKDFNLFTCNSCGSKGLQMLIYEIWPRIKERLPDAKLTAIGGHYIVRSDMGVDDNKLVWDQLVNFPGNKDVTFTGLVTQKQVAEILSQASWFLAPTTFPETFGISLLEAQTYGVPVITTRFGAAEETASDLTSYKINYPLSPNGLFPHIDRPAQIEKYVDTVVNAYNDKETWAKKVLACGQIKDIATWDTIALQWKQFFYRQFKMYLPVDEHRKVTQITRKYHQVFNRRFTNVEDQAWTIPKKKEQRIVVISPFYNAEKYIEKCIQSVQAQDYENYLHILIDDCSTDNSLQLAIRITKENSRVEILHNETNIGAVHNQINNIRSQEGSDIIMLLDGDDSLVNDPNIFNFYNDLYSNDDVEFTYGSCWSMVDNIPLIAQEYPPEVKANKSYRQHKFNWNMPYPHPRTFRKYLLDFIPTDDVFKNEKREWYREGGDNAVFYNILEAADPAKVKVVPDVLYNYNDTNPINDYKVHKDSQNITANEILAKWQPVFDKFNKEILTMDAELPIAPAPAIRLEDLPAILERFKVTQNTTSSKFSVIVLTMWQANVEKFTKNIVRLCKLPLVDEIILVNNSDIPAPPEFSHPKIKILEMGKNIGVCPALNLAVEHAHNDFLFFMGDDVYDFDIKIFDTMVTMLPDLNNGIFGLLLEVDKDMKPLKYNTDIEIKEWQGQYTPGFGTFYFLNKKNWTPIPSQLVVTANDNYIFDALWAQLKKIYVITNLNIDEDYAATTSKMPNYLFILNAEWHVYQPILAEFKKAREQRLQALTKGESVIQNEVKETYTILYKQPPIKILIAIPAAKYIETDCFKSIYDLEIPEGVETYFQCFFGNNISQVRNLIADWVVKGYDYLFAVDSDIAFPPDTLKKLLSHDKPLVSGLYIQRKPDEHNLELYRIDGPRILYPEIAHQGLVEIGGCGFGCVLIKKEVLVTMEHPQFHWVGDLAHQNPTEDVYFCRKAREKGFKLYADTTVMCRHIGPWQYTIQEISQPPNQKKYYRDLSAIQGMPVGHYEYLRDLAAKEGWKPRVIYDIGANVLHWTNMAKYIWADAQYYEFEAFEPVEFLYKENNLPYYIGILSDIDGKEIDFYTNEDHPGAGSYFKSNQVIRPNDVFFFGNTVKQRRKTVTLDTAIKEKNFPLPDLIKMDIQGAEFDVLKGATHALSQCNDLILELGRVQYLIGAPLRDEVIKYLDGIGFDLIKEFCVNGDDGDYHFRRRKSNKVYTYSKEQRTINVAEIENQVAPILAPELATYLRTLSEAQAIPVSVYQYLKERKEKYNLNPKVIYDIGANVLHWTNMAKYIWADAQYYEFDAYINMAFLAKEKNLPYFIGVLSNIDGKEVDFYQNNYNLPEMHEFSHGYYKTNPKYNKAEQVKFTEQFTVKRKTITLDTAIRQMNFPLPDLIKMDVEGAELDIIKGANHALSKCNDLVLELQKVDLARGAPNKDAVIYYLKGIGFDLVAAEIDKQNGPNGDYHFTRHTKV